MMPNNSVTRKVNFSSTAEENLNDDDYTTGYALIIIAIVIILGNGLVLLTVRSFERCLIADIFISCLALLDVIHTATSVLLAIVFKWTSMHHRQSNNKAFHTLCDIQAWFTVTTQIQSAFIVTLINLERLTAVSRPFFYRCYMNTKKTAKILIASLIFSICVSTSPLLGWGKYVVLPKMVLCLFPYDSDYAIVIVVIAYGDLLLVSYCFLAMRVSLRNFMKRQARFVARRGAIVEIGPRELHSPATITKTASKSMQQSKHLIKVTAMVTILFYVSWLPLMVAITRAQATHEHDQFLGLVATLQPLASPLINPLIYFFSWKKYKKSYIKIVKRLVPCCGISRNEATFNAVSKSRSTFHNPVQKQWQPNIKENDINTNGSCSHDLYSTNKIINKPSDINVDVTPRKLPSSSCNDSIMCRALDGVTFRTEANRRHTVGEFPSEIYTEGKLRGSMGMSDHTRSVILPSRHYDTKSRSTEGDKDCKWREPKKRCSSNETTVKHLAEQEKTNSGDKKERKVANECCALLKSEKVSENFSTMMRRPQEPDVSSSLVSTKSIDHSQDSENFKGKCNITKRTGEYLINVMSDQNSENFSKENVSRKSSEERKYLRGSKCGHGDKN